MRESVPVTWGMFWGCWVVMATAGASGAGTEVACAAKFGVGTTMMALPPGAWKVAAARGWAAPPPTAGRGAFGVDVA